MKGIADMRYEARMSAYDVMGEVHCSAFVVRSGPIEQGPPETVLRATTTIQGVGETDPTEWLRDSLLALLESL